MTSALVPPANLVASRERTVYGILATATHQELYRLYLEHAQGVLGGTYEPQAVLRRLSTDSGGRSCATSKASWDADRAGAGQ